MLFRLIDGQISSAGYIYLEANTNCYGAGVSLDPPNTLSPVIIGQNSVTPTTSNSIAAYTVPASNECVVHSYFVEMPSGLTGDSNMPHSWFTPSV